MKRQPVQSSNIVSVGYDAGEKALEVEFKSGGVYRYSGVPADVHAKLIGSESIGKAHRALIAGQYGYESVPQDPKEAS